MSKFPALFSATLTDGPINRLLAMGGPVMVVLVTMAILGLATFIYLILLGALYAPRLTQKLKSIITLWQQNPDGLGPQAIRQQWGRAAIMKFCC